MPFGLEKYNLDWAQLAENKIIELIMNYSYKNNAIPMTDLQNIQCECGHSIFEHQNPDLMNRTAGPCKNKFCICLKGYRKKKVNSNMSLATTDGGWLNILQLKSFLEDDK